MCGLFSTWAGKFYVTVFRCFLNCVQQNLHQMVVVKAEQFDEEGVLSCHKVAFNDNFIWQNILLEVSLLECGV